MTDGEIETRLAELERLLNDPETRLDAHRVWSLLAELRDALRAPSAALRRA